MNEVNLLSNAEASFQIFINGCFGGGFIELRLIPSEDTSAELFFQVNQDGHNSFIVKISRENAEKLLLRLMSYAVSEEIMPKGRYSTTSVQGKVSWKNISYLDLENDRKISLSKKSHITLKDFDKVFSSGKLPYQRSEEIKSCIDKGMFSPTLEIWDVLEQLSKGEKEFLDFIEKL